MVVAKVEQQKRGVVRAWTRGVERRIVLGGPIENAELAIFEQNDGVAPRTDWVTRKNAISGRSRGP